VPVETPVGIRILEDHEAVLQFPFELQLSLGVGVTLRDPQTAAPVQGHGLFAGV
jgi:hypothetical protein